MSEHNPAAEEFDLEDPSESAIESNLKSKATWVRFVFMCLSIFLLWIAGVVGAFVVVVGFFWVLITGEVNRQLRNVGHSLAVYVQQIIQYLTFNTDDRPFPLGGDWPEKEGDPAP